MSELDMDLAFTQQFLSDLARNNNLDWMHAHQAEYKQARRQFEKLAQAVNDVLAQEDPRRLDIDISRRISRLNRDTRFSKDKSPYSPLFRIHLSPSGPQPIPCDLFLCLTAETLLVGGGLFASMFSEATALVRQAILDQADEFDRLIHNQEFAVCLPIRGESLKRVPKPFQADHPLADYLKMKSWYLEQTVELGESNAALIEHMIALAKSMQPFNDFLNKALADFTMPQR